MEEREKKSEGEWEEKVEEVIKLILFGVGSDLGSVVTGWGGRGGKEAVLAGWAMGRQEQEGVIGRVRKLP